jgi:hypothetical protein
MECSTHANDEKCISNFGRELKGYSWLEHVDILYYSM